MKALVFKPSQHWEYCGGGLVVIAQDIQEAQDLINDLSSRKAEPFTELGEFKTILHGHEITGEEYNNDEFYGNHWVLQEALEVVEEKPRIVLYNYQMS